MGLREQLACEGKQLVFGQLPLGMNSSLSVSADKMTGRDRRIAQENCFDLAEAEIKKF